MKIWAGAPPGPLFLIPCRPAAFFWQKWPRIHPWRGRTPALWNAAPATRAESWPAGVHTRTYARVYASNYACNPRATVRATTRVTTRVGTRAFRIISGRIRSGRVKAGRILNGPDLSRQESSRQKPQCDTIVPRSCVRGIILSCQALRQPHLPPCFSHSEMLCFRLV